MRASEGTQQLLAPTLNESEDSAISSTSADNYLININRSSLIYQIAVCSLWKCLKRSIDFIAAPSLADRTRLQSTLTGFWIMVTALSQGWNLIELSFSVLNAKVRLKRR